MDSEPRGPCRAEGAGAAGAWTRRAVPAQEAGPAQSPHMARALQTLPVGVGVGRRFCPRTQAALAEQAQCTQPCPLSRNRTVLGSRAGCGAQSGLPPVCLVSMGNSVLVPEENVQRMDLSASAHPGSRGVGGTLRGPGRQTNLFLQNKYKKKTNR